MKAACPSEMCAVFSIFYRGCKQSNPSTAPKVEKNFAVSIPEMQLFRKIRSQFYPAIKKDGGNGPCDVLATRKRRVPQPTRTRE